MHCRWTLVCQHAASAIPLLDSCPMCPLAFASACAPLAVEEAKKMIEIADYKKNGVIEWDEFIELMSSESKVHLSLSPLPPCSRARALSLALSHVSSVTCGGSRL